MTAKFIAHRGLSGRFPENTHLAFNQAWENDCDGIELDIQVTKDGEIAVIHDTDTERTSGEKLIIADTNFADLGHLNIGNGGKGGSRDFVERIPLLRDVLANMPSGKLVQIEIKHQIENMDAVIAELSRLRDDIVVHIISFDPRKLLRVRTELPELACVLVMDENQPPIDNHVEFAMTHGFVALDMDYKMATPEFVGEVLDTGIQVAHWTVNDAKTAKILIAQGAEFIASDCADALKREINAQ